MTVVRAASRTPSGLLLGTAAAAAVSLGSRGRAPVPGNQGFDFLPLLCSERGVGGGWQLHSPHCPQSGPGFFWETPAPLGPEAPFQPPPPRLLDLRMHGVGCCRRARPGEEGRPGSRLTEDVLGGKLIPVPVMRSPGGPPFRVSGRAGPGARVNRILDWQRCPLLEEGDLIVKLNGADVRGLSSGQVEGLLQEHLPADDVVLLVRREAPRRQAPTHREPSCSRSPESPTCSPLCSPCTPRRRRLSQPPSAKGKPWLRPSEPPPEPPGAPDHPPTPFHPPGARAPAPEAVEVTSFMDPEPRDVPWCPWRGRGPGPPRGASGQRTLDAPDGRGWEARGLGALTEVVLRRREDEGFGIVLVTEEMAGLGAEGGGKALGLGPATGTG